MSRPWGKGFYNLIFNPSFKPIDFVKSGIKPELIFVVLLELPFFIDFLPDTGL